MPHMTSQRKHVFWQMNRVPSFLMGPLGLFLLTGLLVLSPLLDGGTSHLAVMGIRLIILVWISFYLWTSLESQVIRYWTSPHLFIVILFLAVAIFSTIRSSYWHQSLQWLLILFGYASLLYLIVLSLSSWDHITRLFWVIGGVGLFQMAWALVQVQQGVVRPTGTFFNPNFLACYLAVGWAIVLAYIVHVSGRQYRSKYCGPTAPKKLLFHVVGPFLYLAAIAGILMLSGSRGGLMACLASTVVILGMRFGWKGQGVILAIVLVVLVLPNPLQQRILTEHHRNPAAYSRIHMWEGAIQEMLDHPFGVGLGMYRYVAPQYAFPLEREIIRYGQISRRTHNEFLQVGVEMSVVGLLLFLGGIMLLIRETVKVLRKRLTRSQRSIVVGAGGGIIVLVTHALVDSTFHVPSLAIVLTVLAAIVLSASRLTGAGLVTVRERHLTWPGFLGGAGVALLGLTLFYTLKLSTAWMAYEEGVKAMRGGEHAKAMTSYQKAISIDPTKALYHRALASTYFEKFQRSRNPTNAQQSVGELQRAIELNPLDGRAYGLLGHVLKTFGSSLERENPRRVGLFQEAYEAYRTALKYEPFSVFNRLELARILGKLNKKKQGEALIQEAISMEPNFLPGRAWLAAHLWESGRSEEAKAQIQEIKKRQNLYKDMKTNNFEKSFLRVDVRALERLENPVG